MVIGVCVGCVGYSSNTAAMMEIIRDMFDYVCSSKLEKLRACVSWDEIDASYDAYHKGEKETDPVRAYELFMTAYCGNGKSAFSKEFKIIVENTVKEFCENQDLFVGSFYDMKRKFTEQTMDFCEHSNKPIVGCYCNLSEALSKMAELHQATGNMDKAVFLQKQAIFWQFLYAKDYKVLYYDLCNAIEKLGRMINAL